MLSTQASKPSDNPAWKFNGLTALYGGPAMSTIAEHSHSEVQVSVHFRPQSLPSPGQRPAHVHLYASGQLHSGGWEQGSEVIVFHLSPLLLSEAANELACAGTCEIRPFRMGRDHVLEQLGSILRHELRSPRRASTFYVESIGHVVAGHILRTHAEIRPRSFPAKALSTHQLRILRRFIADRIAVGFTVTDLAQCLAMGPHRFARELQRATGFSPWRFVQNERLSMARRLLESPGHSIADVASRLGFTDQSHFTNDFRHHQGVTPKVFRSSSRG